MKNNKIDLKFIILMVVLISGFYFLGSKENKSRYQFDNNRPLVIDTYTGEVFMISASDSLDIKQRAGVIVKKKGSYEE